MTDETNYEHRGAAPWNRAAFELADREVATSDAQIAQEAEQLRELSPAELEAAIARAVETGDTAELDATVIRALSPAEQLAAARATIADLRHELAAAERDRDAARREIAFARQALVIGAETDLVNAIVEQIEETDKAKAERDDLKGQDRDLFIRLQDANEAIRERDHELGELTDQLAAGGAPSASAQLVGRDVWLTTVPRGAEESHNFRSEVKLLGVDATGVLVTFITWSKWERDTFTGRYDEEDGSEIWTMKPRTRSDRGRCYYPWSQVQSIELIEDREASS